MGLAGLTFLLGAIAGAIGLAAFNDWRTNEVEAAETEVELSTVTVGSADLATFIEFDGSLGFATTTDVVSVGDGTFTMIPPAGADLARGDVLYEIDAEPVVMFYGDLPTWRDLEIGVADGRDIAQLEANLWASGYTVDIDDGHGPYLVVDDEFDWPTAIAIKAWETDLGIDDPDGVFERERALFVLGEIRVDDPVSEGSTARTGESVMTATITSVVTDIVDEELATVTGQTTSPTELVTLEVDTAEQGAFAVGNTVDVELSDGRIAVGEVAEIAEVARRIGTGAGATLVVDVVVEVVEVPDGGLLEGPVLIRVVETRSDNATVVPVRALVALAEGGYAVEIVEAGESRLVGVETGLFAEGQVEVVGVEPDDTIVVPS